jgi:hypothetical protein
MNFEKTPNTSYKPQIGHKKEKLYEMFAAPKKCGSIKSFKMFGILAYPCTVRAHNC